MLKLVVAILIATPVLAQTRPTCEDGLADTTYKPVPGELPGYPGQLNLFKVTRVVGPGLPTEYALPTSLTLNSSTVEQYIAQGVLKRQGSLEVKSRLTFPANAWALLGSIPGVSSVTISAKYVYFFNGVRVFETGRKITLSATAPLGTAQSLGEKSHCVGIQAGTIRFARRLIGDDPLANGGAQLPCPSQLLATVTAGEKTCPGINQVTVSIATPSIELLGVNGQVIGGTGFIGTTYSVALLNVFAGVNPVGLAGKLRFDAMAPVILVHGIRAGPTSGYRSQENLVMQPGQKPDWFTSYLYSPPGVQTGPSQWFRKPFFDSKVPHASARFNDHELRYSGFDQTGNVGTAIATAVALFGAKYCHLVGHSGGGLWSKAFIRAISGSYPISASASLKTLTVRSLTTISTPHAGSVNADRLCLVNRGCGPIDENLITGEQALDSVLSGNTLWSPLIPDMRVAAATAYSLAGDPPSLSIAVGVTRVRHKVAYQAIWADANINDSCASGPAFIGAPGLIGEHPGTTSCSFANLPTISNVSDVGAPDESVGYQAPDPDIDIATIPNGVINNWRVANTPYELIFRNDAIESGPCAIDPTKRCLVFVLARPPNLNDFNVSKKSAVTAGFDNLGGLRANHTTVGRAETGQKVLAAIFAVEGNVIFRPTVVTVQ